MIYNQFGGKLIIFSNNIQIAKNGLIGVTGCGHYNDIKILDHIVSNSNQTIFSHNVYDSNRHNAHCRCCNYYHNIKRCLIGLGHGLWIIW